MSILRKEATAVQAEALKASANKAGRQTAAAPYTSKDIYNLSLDALELALKLDPARFPKGDRNLLSALTAADNALNEAAELMEKAAKAAK